MRGQEEAQLTGGGPRARHEALAILTQVCTHGTGTHSTHARVQDSHSKCTQHSIYPLGQFYQFLRHVPGLCHGVETTVEGSQGPGGGVADALKPRFPVGVTVGGAPFQPQQLRGLKTPPSQGKLMKAWVCACLCVDGLGRGRRGWL